ncbi:putative calcofluor white hypersensitive protein [Phaeomoniella chlamydospora]|uniref:Putative calcofluor white hypersensitive protein n=1 Tax=Phaeomoniella chlamydospora TaxID=158046 RepID=A0A0G2G2R5_PHACM|nr:putative calcofluor white hypersensitive protein [Phaeomoniella chlamydospora]
MVKRGVAAIGLAAAGGAGYYLYNAGGDPKAAQKYAEADASKVTAKIKGELPGRGKEAEKRGEAFASQAGKTLDDTVAEAKAKAAEAEKAAEQYSKDGKAKFEKYSKEAKAELNATIDQFDKTVEQKTSEAKSGISSWFGFGKK